MGTDEGFGTEGEAKAMSEAGLQALLKRVTDLEGQVAELRRESGRTGTQAQSFGPKANLVAHEAGVESRSQASTTEIAPPPLPPVTGEMSPGQSIESRLGSQVFNLVGIAAIILGTSWGLKLAFEHGWIGPVGRILIGLGAGSGLVVWSEGFRRRGLAAFSYSLKAVGCGVLYLSLWAAFQLYHLLPATVALTAMMLVTGWIAFMAWSQDAELLAGYALAGGLATPLLISTGGDHQTFLFTYLAAIDVATVGLIRTKPWSRLLVPAFLATVAYVIGWYTRYYRFDAAVGLTGPFWETIAFVLIFFAMFALVSTRGWTRYLPGQERAIVPILVPIANAFFVGLALYSVFEDSGLHAWLPWLMVGLAAIYLGLMRVQRTAIASALHLAAAIVFVTIAIPLKASGHSLTVAWLIEGLGLCWIYARVGVKTAAQTRVLLWLSASGYGLGLISLLAHWFWLNDARSNSFFNPGLASALVAVVTLAGAAVLGGWGEDRVEERTWIAYSALVAIDLVGLLLASEEILRTDSGRRMHPAFAHLGFFNALVGMVVLAGSTWASYRLAKLTPLRSGEFRYLAGGKLILFNLVAIVCFEREIIALWDGSRMDVGLQRSLATSGFLMAYGAVLLAVGFWRRDAFVRWQALVLLMLTIAKVFLWDFNGLSAGYRVASFMGLGALLMAVSFAYQKDWLGLKPYPLKNVEREAP